MTPPDAQRDWLGPLFDAAFYRGEAGLARDDDAFAHYVAHGATAGLKPNVVFDPAWYVARHPDAADNPLLHYASSGEPADFDPSPLFDVGWYRRAYAAERPLAHYLSHRFGPFSPIPEFDAEFYLKTYSDVGAARMDPFLHYLHFGHREFRKPRADFNPRLYAQRFLSQQRGVNPLAHFRAHRAAAPQARRPGPYEAVKHFSRRGPRFEAPAAPGTGAARALILTFHLTQYHRIAENDAWWGEGFTEWTQLARGQPRFEGHYQPRVPGELGFYDLSRPEALKAQAARAKAAGVGGFVFYYYDFDGKRLLETPLELFLADPGIDIGFCLMWANENWTRRWDGAEDELLIAQDYDPRHEARRVADFARHFRDPRYVRLEGRPVLMVYRASLVPETAATLARWRRLFEQDHGERPIFMMAQCFDDLDPRPLGFDAAVEFPPHKLTKGLPQIYDSLDIYDEAFEADVFAYDDLVQASLAEPAPDFPLIKTAVPAWDNDARRQGRGLTLVGSTPYKYQRWLAELIARAAPVFGARVVCVNAWNEWSEGAYLEPDVHFGAAYLNATARATFGDAPRTRLALPGPARRLAAAFGVAPDIAGLEGEIADAAIDEDEEERRLRALFPRVWPDAAMVSVFVLHSGPTFAPMRLRSVFAQTHPVLEVVVLDAGEAALEPVDAEARAANRDVGLGLGVADPLRQAAAMASGEFVWIVEAGGVSDPACLATLAAPLLADRRAAFAYGDSRPADAEGRPRYARPPPLGALQRPASYVDRSFDGAALADGGADVEPPVLSATLWRRAAIASALAEGEIDAAALWRKVAAAPGARVFHVAETLDRHLTAPGG